MNPHLLEKLKTVPTNSALGAMISLAIKNNRLDELEKTLRDYHEDNSNGLNQLLGFDFLKYAS